MNPHITVWILVALFALGCAVRFVYWLVDCIPMSWEAEQEEAWNHPERWRKRMERKTR